MNELIRIETRADGERFVDARALHEFLEIGKDFSTWIAGRIKQYGFVENLDFSPILGESSGGRPSKEYTLSIDMAKELSMVERNEKGKQARQYFIQCEKIAKDSMRQNNPIQLLPVQIQRFRLENINLLADTLERFGSLDDRDKMDLADEARSTRISNLLPARTDAALPVTISGRAIDLGIKLDRGDLVKVGKITACLYREKHDKDPVKHIQYVDGAARQVNSYTENDLDIIDQAIKEVYE